MPRFSPGHLTPAQRVPGYLPYPQPVGPVADWPVPNQAFGFWPQGQLQPNYLPPGHKSFIPYKYPNYRNAQVSPGSDLGGYYELLGPYESPLMPRDRA